MMLRNAQPVSRALAAAVVALSLGSASSMAATPGAVPKDTLIFQAHDNPGFQTYAFGIEKHGTVAGYYFDANFRAIGLLRSADGTYTELVYPKTPDMTFALAINNSGNVAGHGQLPGGYETYGWFFDSASQNYTPIEVPRARSTNVWGLNNHNVAAGTAYFYEGATSRSIGFTWKDGKFDYYRVPDALFTEIHAINDAGDVGGTYFGSDGRTRDFIWKADGTMLTLDPLNEFGKLMELRGLNRRGDFVGQCYDQDWNPIGCFYRNSQSEVTSFKLEGFSALMPGGMSLLDIVGYGFDASTGVAKAVVIPKASVLAK